MTNSELMAKRYTLKTLYRKRDEAYANGKGDFSETAKIMWAIALQVTGRTCLSKSKPKRRRRFNAIRTDTDLEGG